MCASSSSYLNKKNEATFFGAIRERALDGKNVLTHEKEKRKVCI